jgi:hypothetical protein
MKGLLTMRRMFGLWLIAAGSAAVAIGLGEGAQVVIGIVDQAQGKCDYLSCTGPSTLPALTGDLVLVAAGAVQLAAWAYRVSRAPSSTAEGDGSQG